MKVLIIPPGISGEDLHGKNSFWSIMGKRGAEAHTRRLKAAVAGARSKASDRRIKKETKP